MNFAHLHLLLNHFPIIGTIIGFGLFLISMVGKNEDLRRASLIIFAAMALITIPTFMSGTGAQTEIRRNPAVSETLIETHQGSAMLALLFMEITGALALVALWQSQKMLRLRWSGTLSAVLVFSVITVGLMARVGTTGGDIRHPEIESGPETAASSPAIYRFLDAIDPSPSKFADLMTANKWWWAFMMDVHFIGLALIIGTIGILDLRMLGFAKQIPIGSLHRLMPWAMAGFGLNVVTGLMAFMGMPQYYTYDVAFWLKILAILLVGINVAAFYLTDAFNSVQHLGAGEDAPPLAKFIAASSLVIWFAVITLGRYIQSYSDTIAVHK